MNMLKVKKSITLLVGMMTITAFSGIAQAETRFAVQDPTGTTDKMVVTDTGFIGIGTNAPNAAISIAGTSGPGSQLVNQYNGTTSLGGGGFIGYHNNDAGALPSANDRLGYFYFGSLNGASPLNSAGMSAKAEATWTASPLFMPSYFAIETTATNTRTEKMRVTAAGNVGIGTGTPTQKLEVSGGLRLWTTTAKPATCDSTLRGVIWFAAKPTGTADTLEVCSRDAAGTYAWRSLIN